MFRFRRNKSELIVLTGAIYAFVAYLTAFTLEILFIVDLTRRSNDILSTAATAPSAHQAASTATSIAGLHPDGAPPATSLASPHLASLDDDLFLRHTGLDRFRFESIQAHITVSCLAIAILYFIVFITSLVLIVALILRSTFMLLIWMCAMITMYLPEFCLVAYVSVYCWGPDTRNGQTEIVFYLIRAALNAIFIFRAHKLFKQLNYEKNFFRLKSGGRTSVSSQFAGYDSPYFIGDSLTTTINPVYNSSTLNLNRYDYIRDHHFQPYGSSSGGQSPATNNSMFDNEFSHNNQSSTAPSSTEPSNMFHSNYSTGVASRYSARDRPQNDPAKQTNAPRSNYHGDPFALHYNYSRNIGRLPATTNKHLSKFYLGEMPNSRTKLSKDGMQHQTSVLSIDDELDECELDLDYRTLGRSSRHAARDADSARRQRHPVQRRDQELDQRGTPNTNRGTQLAQINSSLSRSQDDLPAYSTQSLDRRNMRDFALTEHVILRPLGHQPFEYLHRPGSTSNLDCLTTNPASSKTRHNTRKHHQGH